MTRRTVPEAARRISRDEAAEMDAVDVGREMPVGDLAREEAAILAQMREAGGEAASLDDLIHTANGLDVLAELPEGSKARAGLRFKVHYQDEDGERYHVQGPWENGAPVPTESFLAGLLAKGRLRFPGLYIVTLRKKAILANVRLYLHPPMGDVFQERGATSRGGDAAEAMGLLRAVLTSPTSALALPAGVSNASVVERLRERLEELEDEDRAKTSELEALARRVAELETFAQQALVFIQQAQQGADGEPWAKLAEKALEAFSARQAEPEDRAPVVEAGAPRGLNR